MTDGTRWNGAEQSEARDYLNQFHRGPRQTAREFLLERWCAKVERILGGTRPPAGSPAGACNPSAPAGPE